MLFQFISYCKFLVKSTNQHGVHSPFVYDLVTKCLCDVSHKKWYDQYAELRKSLLKDTSSIKVEDFGAGSKRLSSHERMVSSIAKNAGISVKRAHLLGNLATYLQTENILEIGTSVGLATAALYLGNPQGHVTTLEGCKNTLEIAKKVFQKQDFKHIQTRVGNFKETLPNTLQGQKYDLIFFDGNHQKMATLHYFEQCLSAVHNNTLFIFDDIYWSRGMYEAWQKIIEHPMVTVSIDTFQWGFVFFRKEQPKQHFIIRI